MFHGIHFGGCIEPYRHPLSTFRRNIVYWREGCLSHNLDCNRWDPATRADLVDRNLYWKAGQADFEAPRLGRIPAGQVRLGLGHNGRRAWATTPWPTGRPWAWTPIPLNVDPRFVDPAENDYRLQDDSPAFELGFEPIDLSEVGPR